MICAYRSSNGDGRRLAAIFAAMLLAVVSFAAPASAGLFQVDPVSIELAPGQRIATLSVKNRDAEPASIRVRIYRWSQSKGEDVYSETDELIASPPIFTVAPDRAQLIRVGPRRGSVAGAYRVILEEIPAAGDDIGIRVALRLNLPLYILSGGDARPNLSWSAWRTDGGDLMIEAQNAGARHSQILELGTVDRSGKPIILTSEMGVVLPGSTKRWNVGSRPEFQIGSNLQLGIRNGRGETSLHQVTLELR